MPSIEVDEATFEKLRDDARRRAISIERMTKAIVFSGFADVDERIAAAEAQERPAPSAEFVERAMEHGRRLVADLRELEAAGWPPGPTEPVP